MTTNRVPHLVFINKATVPLGVDLNALVAATALYVNTYLYMAWGVRCTCSIANNFLPGAWAIVLLDTADVAGALGYHDLTPDGLPIAKIFVKTTIDDGQKVSVTVTHEVAEMLIDSAINMWSDGPVDAHGNPTCEWAYESADAVEETTFAINGIEVSNFVYPTFFESFHKPGSTKFDYLGLVKQPFQLLPGGYSIIRKLGKISQIFGSKEKEERFAKEDRRHHRSESRGKPLVHSLSQTSVP